MRDGKASDSVPHASELLLLTAGLQYRTKVGEALGDNGPLLRPLTGYIGERALPEVAAE